ncbi:STAS/SEC14 domain-containing protein [Dyella sp.]|uniref:STAS/SEC14 domain-containing protein n=1 Tax=Dyella sp. TaxID=1869338 RepID=UPI002ED45F96
MIVQLGDLPAGVLGFSAHGQITARDYETVLIPDIEAAFALNRKLRVLFHIDNDCTGFDPGAMWDDLKLGFRHITGWERVALVSDVGWVRTMARLFGFAMPCQFKLFGDNQMAQARAWIGALDG